MNAKEILKDKFWIVEDQGVRIGTLSKNDDSFVYSDKAQVKLYNSEKS